MKVTEHFEKAKGETLTSFEVLPPLKGGSMQAIFDIMDPLMEFKPPFIDVTYHREEYIYNMRESGYYEKIAIRKRPGTVGICASIMHHYARTLRELYSINSPKTRLNAVLRFSETKQVSGIRLRGLSSFLPEIF